MLYDPITDEKKDFTIQEWADMAKKEIDVFSKIDWSDKTPRTWNEWMKMFVQYMSW